MRMQRRFCLCDTATSLLFFKILLFYFQFLILWYAVPQAAVDPQCRFQRETRSHTRHLAAQRAPDAQHASPLWGHGLQARATKRVAAEEHSGNMLAPGVALIAHATLVIFTQHHGTERKRQSPRENVWGVYMNGLFRSFKDVTSPARVQDRNWTRVQLEYVPQ